MVRYHHNCPVFFYNYLDEDWQEEDHKFCP